MSARRWAVAGSAALVACLVLVLQLRPGGTDLTEHLDDLVQLAAALVATGMSARRAATVRGRTRLSWALIAAGTGSWAAGQAIWSYFELILHQPTPFPSVADAGFLLFPLLTGTGIVVRPSRAFTGRAAARIVLDVATVLTSLLAVSWATALGVVFRGTQDSSLAHAVSIAYPAGDVALLTVVVIVLSYAGAESRRALAWLGAGLAALAVADSGFAYLTATDSYATGDVIDVAWVSGFLIIAVSAFEFRAGDEATARDRDGSPAVPSAALLLPYVPAAFGIVAATSRVILDRGDTAALWMAGSIFALLVCRQVFVLMDNRLLLETMSYQAVHDSLTGLPNRALFTDRLGHALELHRRTHRPISVLLVDLDDFKTVNDSLGHPAGDDLLGEVSERLRVATRAGDTVARLGGDEFAILIEDGGDAHEVAARIAEALRAPVTVAGRTIPISASIGIAGLRPDETTASSADLLARADAAMYDAKRGGKARVAEFHDRLGDFGTNWLDLRTALVADIAGGAIDVALQPIYGADSERFAAEALARWHHRGRPVPPNIFLPLAAAAGLAPALDRVVCEKAIAAAAQDGSARPELLCVNLAASTLAEPTLREWLTETLERHGYPAQRLVVEVLESEVVTETAIGNLARLQEIGVRVAIDDFGAGYANLARLTELRPQIIKLDRTITAQLITTGINGGARPGSSLILDAITHLAHRLGAQVIAEGIETATQHAAVLAAGCDAAQGFHLGRPELVPSRRMDVLSDAA